MLLKSLDLSGNPVALNIGRTFRVTFAASVLAALVPSGAWAHSRHHHHHSQSTAPAPVKYASPVDVAGAYGHTAAISLASDVNQLRSTMIVATASPDNLDINTKVGQTAAIHLAGNVNQLRSTMKVAAASPTDADVDTKYAQTAASRLACNVNHARAAVAHKDASHHATHEAHASRHEQRLAMRAEHHRQHAVRVAQQDVALRSGDVVMAANSFRGTRYVFGGTSRSGFDCSSFVRYVLGHADGVDLPRTAEEQYYHGAPVSREDLRPGDLVFFKNTYRHGISHVGIYTGNGKFVHAANSHKGVREDSLDTSYYNNHYAGARRVIGIR